MQKSVKSSSVLDLSKIDDTHETNELNFNTAANIPYDKSELKWRSSPKSNFSLKHINIFPFFCCFLFVYVFFLNKQRNITKNLFVASSSSPRPPSADAKFLKSPTALASPATTSSPFTAASTANILLNNRMNQFYPRPNLAFHSHNQQHSISKHFHHMLNQHSNFLQNSSIAFDRTSISGSLNLTTGYNHSHHDVITSASAQQHHLH